MRELADTDDDNIPSATVPFVLQTNEEGDVCADVVNRSAIAWNAYRHFGVPHLHNRGLPLRHVRPGQPLDYEDAQYVRPLIQQGVVHCDPDLDAIQRLTMSPAYTSDVKFSETSTFLAFPPRSYHPINSQNTVFLYDGFWALLLPVTTLWREDDIFRGYWSQRLLWEVGGSLVMTGPTAYQLRNPHDFFLDYRMEYKMYLHAEGVLDRLNRWSCPHRHGLGDCIKEVMADLNDAGFIGRRDVLLSAAWVADLESLGYVFPVRRAERAWQERRVCKEAAKLPKSFLDAVVSYSKEELQAIFEPVDCGVGERLCLGLAALHARADCWRRMLIMVDDAQAMSAGAFRAKLEVHLPAATPPSPQGVQSAGHAEGAVDGRDGDRIFWGKGIRHAACWWCKIFAVSFSLLFLPLNEVASGMRSNPCCARSTAALHHSCCAYSASAAALSLAPFLDLSPPCLPRPTLPPPQYTLLAPFARHGNRQR